MLLEMPLSNPVLRNELQNYARPNDKISYMMDKGELIGLAKGHYVTRQAKNNNMHLNLQIANVLYGPSYISRYSALAFYGLLAESTTRIESMTPKRSKTIENEIGIFEYSTLADSAVFSTGIVSKKINETTTILIASPEKAICDIIWTSSKLDIRNINDLIYFLEEDIRMEIDVLQNANKTDLQNCIAYGKKKKEIQLLLDLTDKI
jgi:predicted transcriptional regulator of viral defense system